MFLSLGILVSISKGLNLVSQVFHVNYRSIVGNKNGLQFHVNFELPSVW